jgi:hypothetical protein
MCSPVASLNILFFGGIQKAETMLKATSKLISSNEK